MKPEREYGIQRITPEIRATQRGIWAVSQLSLRGSEPAQLFGDSKLDGIVGPMVWAFTHDSRRDIVTGSPLYHQLPIKNFAIKPLARYDPFSVPPVDWLIRTVFANSSYFVYRTHIDKGFLSIEEIERRREHNDLVFDSVWEGYTRGVHSGIAVEGTSKTNGRLTAKSVRAGVYRLAVRYATEGPWAEVMPILPVGITVDFMGNEEGLEVPCFAVGEPYFHEATLHREPGWQARDRDKLLAEVRTRLAKQTVVTVSNVLGEHLYWMTRKSIRNRRSAHIGVSKLKKLLDSKIEDLCYEGQIIIEEGVKRRESRQERFDAFVDNLVRAKYVFLEQGVLRIDTERMSRVPTNRDKMKEVSPDGNPLQFMVNRLYNLMEVRPEVKKVLRKSRSFF
jgi:hypothetical protein